MAHSADAIKPAYQSSWQNRRTVNEIVARYMQKCATSREVEPAGRQPQQTLRQRNFRAPGHAYRSADVASEECILKETKSDNEADSIQQHRTGEVLPGSPTNAGSECVYQNSDDGCTEPPNHVIEPEGSRRLYPATNDSSTRHVQRSADDNRNSCGEPTLRDNLLATKKRKHDTNSYDMTERKRPCSTQASLLSIISKKRKPRSRL